jgi:uncharacterized protein YxeA
MATPIASVDPQVALGELEKQNDASTATTVELQRALAEFADQATAKQLALAATNIERGFEFTKLNSNVKAVNQMDEITKSVKM